jgi:hypothetical protein
MKQGSNRDSLERVQRRFAQWRSQRAPSTRIPEDLWQAAVESGREHGVSKTAKALRLDYYGLKKRLESTPEEGQPVTPRSGRGFVEIPLGVPAAGSDYVLELKDVHGARLRVELKGASPAEVESLARAFWSMAR